MERLTEQLGGLRRQAGADREALKRATRAQKQRAERSEDTAGQLSVQLLDMVRCSEELLLKLSQNIAQHIRYTYYSFH